MDLHKLPRELVSDPDADGNAPPGLGHPAGPCRRWDLTTLASLSLVESGSVSLRHLCQLPIA
jgi:hypothetical protein